MDQPITNPFTEASSAERYQKFRPRYHEQFCESLKKYLGRKFHKTLDVACGTGHSTVALAKISENIIGCDISLAMLEEARKNSAINFIEAPAEKLPFPDQSFELLNMSMAFHWVQQPQFMKEA